MSETDLNLNKVASNVGYRAYRPDVVRYPF
jgi:hypothetical protein